MKLFNTSGGVLLEKEKSYYLTHQLWDELVNQQDLHQFLTSVPVSFESMSPAAARDLIDHRLLPPIGSQEVWAAGVTYLRSMEARMEESLASGGADLYERVYNALRPELFFKAMPHRVAGHKQDVNIRRDSQWNVPEPELALYIDSSGNIQGYTIANDMSSRSIEGENALYLPQAKIYERSAALGPCLYVPDGPIDPATQISISISRNNQALYQDTVRLSKMKRSLVELAEFLYRECDFKYGSYLMTGTCLVPPDEFTLYPGDLISITIEGIGTLTNKVALKSKHQR